MQNRITQSSRDAAAKDQTIQQIEIEKREIHRKFEALEQQNFGLLERLAAAEANVDVLQADNSSLTQQLFAL